MTADQIVSGLAGLLIGMALVILLLPLVDRWLRRWGM